MLQIPQLFIHSNFSFLNSTISIDEIINFSLKNKHKYSVISEFKYCFSFLNFFNQATKNDLIPIFSLQFPWKNSDLLLIAKNYQGFSNLLKISSFQKIEEEFLDGIIIIHLEGEILFSDHSDFYIANQEVENGVFIRENRFLTETDFDFFCLLQAIKNSSSLENEKIFNQHLKKNFLYQEDELDKNSWQVKNIFKILNFCENYKIPKVKNQLDFFESEKKNSDEKLKELCFLALNEKKFRTPEIEKKYLERMLFELDVIIKKKFSSYFLVVNDAVNWAKKNNIFIGPGRGSACGSLVSYLLNITEIDPLKYDLYFERFLNPDRFDNPDIDIDIQGNKRELLINYLVEKYGKGNCAYISTLQTFKYKNSFQSIGKACEIPESEIQKVLSSADENTLYDLSKNSDLHFFFKKYPYFSMFLEKIKDFPKNNSIHPAGIIISSISFEKFLPLIKKNDSVDVIQWTADDLKSINLIKFDFLSLNYLHFLAEIREKVEKKYGKKISLSKINENDLNVYKTIIFRKNAAIFQFENEKILDLISSFKPASLEDLALISAIHRPGASSHIPVLLQRKNSISDWKDSFQIFGEILVKTFGIIVYQEQLMKIFSEVTKLSFGEADSFRRNLLSNESELNEILKENFITLGIKNKYLAEDLVKIWDLLFEFSKYSFNLSHAIAYAKISYFLLWFKTYYPDIFYQELLNLFGVSIFYLSEIEISGFEIKKADILHSKLNFFALKDKEFYFPINKISSLSSNFFEKFPKLEKRKFFSALEAIEFFAQKGILKNDILVLIQAGFFNSLFQEGESEYFFEENLSEIYESAIFLDENNEKIFDLNLKKVSVDEKIKERYKKLQEKYFGINLNVLKINSDFLKKHKISPLNQIYLQQSKDQLYFSFLSDVKKAKTNQNKDFFWIKLSDSFFKTHWIPYFSDDEKVLECQKKQNVIAATVSKNKNNLKIKKIVILKNNE